MSHDVPECFTLLATTPDTPVKPTPPVAQDPPAETPKPAEVIAALESPAPAEPAAVAEPVIDPTEAEVSNDLAPSLLAVESAPTDAVVVTAGDAHVDTSPVEPDPAEAAAMDPTVCSSEVTAAAEEQDCENPPDFRFQLEQVPSEAPPFEYLVEYLLPQRGFCGIVGLPGSGTSTLGCVFAAAVTTGGLFANRQATKGEVIMVVGDDDVESVVAPCLRAQGADTDLVYFHRVGSQAGCPRILDLLTDQALIGKELELHPGVRAIIFDPLDLLLSTKDANRIRVGTSRLLEMLRTKNVALIGIMRLRAKDFKTIGDVIDGLPLASLASEILLVEQDCRRPDRRRVGMIKGKFSWPKELIFEFDESGKLDWVSTRDTFAVNRRSGVLQDVVDWLLRELGTGPKESYDMIVDYKAAGFSHSTVARAKDVVGAKSKKIDDVWHWYLPD